jgi:hypothetical protein
MPPIIQTADGKLEFEFNKKATVIDPKKTEETLVVLVRLIATLDQRIQALENH